MRQPGVESRLIRRRYAIASDQRGLYAGEGKPRSGCHACPLFRFRSDSVPAFPFSVNSSVAILPTCSTMANLLFGDGRMEKPETLGLIRGAKPLAAFVFGDPDQFKKIYGMKAELSLFHLNGQVCGRPETIRDRIAQLEAEAAQGAETAT
jgi:hypothetical protein